METLGAILGTLSGLRFVRPDLEPGLAFTTALAMHLTYAFVCVVFAAQRGRRLGPWFVVGLLTGAVGTLTILLIGDGRSSE